MPVRDKEKQKVYSQRAYAKNKEKYKARARRHDKVAVKRNKAYVAAYFETHPCVDCGEADPIVLEFDHVRGEKLYHVSDMVCNRKMSLTKIAAEIAKCDVRCANCHRRVTHQRRNK